MSKKTSRRQNKRRMFDILEQRLPMKYRGGIRALWRTWKDGTRDYIVHTTAALGTQVAVWVDVGKFWVVPEECMEYMQKRVFRLGGEERWGKIVPCSNAIRHTLVTRGYAAAMRKSLEKTDTVVNDDLADAQLYAMSAQAHNQIHVTRAQLQATQMATNERLRELMDAMSNDAFDPFYRWKGGM